MTNFLHMGGEVFIAGFGYVGQRLAQLLLAQDVKVTGLVRNTARQLELAAKGFGSVVGDLDMPESLPKLDLADKYLCYFAPPPKSGDEDTRLQHFLSHLETLPKRAILISTTGVYGDCAGEWVDESKPPAPATDRARRRLHAENVFSQWANSMGIKQTILRVPGIYGPTRLPLERLKKRAPLPPAKNCSWTNRIHVDDLVNAIAGLLRHDGHNDYGGVYNISDGRPLKMTDYFNAVADIAGVPRPPVISWEQAQQTLGAGMLSYLKESRRIDGRLLLKDLQMELRYSDYEKGIRDSL